VTVAEEYLDALVERVRALLGDELVGVYAGGSYALGGYVPGRSDLDVAVVCRERLTRLQKDELGAALRHESLPCPARGLELVVYTEAIVRSGTADPGYELNLNTGSGMPFVLSTSPEGEAHWYAIDRAIVREHGVALVGPAPADVVAPIARELLVGRVLESARWYAAHPEAARDDAVLNACRAWRFASEGDWTSKTDAGEWALTRLRPREAVVQALAARSGAGVLDRGSAAELLGDVELRLARLAASVSSSSHS
jgi:hypothetical protein